MPSPPPLPERPARRVGFVTIGQSPRDDVVPGMRPYLGAVEVLEAGALDGLDAAEIAALAPRDPDRVLVTRLRDGSSVKVDKELVLPRLAECVVRLEAAGAAVIVLLCTGSFPPLASRALVLEPDRILRHVVLAVARSGSRIGVMVPAEDQVNALRARWQTAGVDPVVAAASPYGSRDARLEAARRLREAGAELVVLDCVGYTRAMKEDIAPIVNCPVLVAHEAVARVAGAWL
ncbi:MAG TPA: AroM family protein [Limnochordales bacterium]